MLPRVMLMYDVLTSNGEQTRVVAASTLTACLSKD
jgi:hypothetical protein